ncbi:MAG: ribonuclease P protein component [Pirellulaceae bacterium]
MKDQSFPRECRLTSRSEFDHVYQRGAVASDSILTIRAVRSQVPHSRLGLSVSRRVGNAVVRNAWKRRIRESFRQIGGQLSISMDLVVQPRPGPTRTQAEIQGSLERLIERLRRKLPAQA